VVQLDPTGAPRWATTSGSETAYADGLAWYPDDSIGLLVHEIGGVATIVRYAPDGTLRSLRGLEVQIGSMARLAIDAEDDVVVVGGGELDGLSSMFIEARSAADPDAGGWTWIEREVDDAPSAGFFAGVALAPDGVVVVGQAHGNIVLGGVRIPIETVDAQAGYSGIVAARLRFAATSGPR
jgi:hypothetical protein